MIHSLISLRIRSWVPCMLASALVCTASVSQANDYQLLENRFSRLRSQFDSLIKKCADQKAVDALTTSYKGGLTRFQEEIATKAPQLVPNVKAEIDRADHISRNYLSSPDRFRRISLWDGWQQNNENKLAASDFKKVVGAAQAGAPSPNMHPDFAKDATILEKPYLCSIDDFIDSVGGLKGLRATRARVLVGMPGFPKGSFYYHSFDGNFSIPNLPPGFFNVAYNRLYVVTDSLDQVVAVQVTKESPQGSVKLNPSDLGIYNFVQFRRKGSSAGLVSYKFFEGPKQGWIQSQLEVNGDCKEIVLMVLPKPTLQLVRHALGQQ